MRKALSVFTVLRRLFVLGIIVFVGYFVLLANRSPQVSKEKKKITIKANPNPKITVEVEKAENPNLNAKETIKKVDPKEAKETLAKNLMGAGGPSESRTITLIHLHSPGDPDSDTLAQTIEDVRVIYPEQLLVTTVDVKTDPKKLTQWRMKSSPSVVFQTESERLYTFEGVWPEDRLKAKVRELIHGLKRVNKDWRPPVEGMERR